MIFGVEAPACWTADVPPLRSECKHRFTLFTFASSAALPSAFDRKGVRQKFYNNGYPNAFNLFHHKKVSIDPHSTYTNFMLPPIQQ